MTSVPETSEPDPATAAGTDDMTSTISSIPVEEHQAIMDDAEIDLNSDRRKRRKISPIHESTEYITSGGEQDGEGPETWQQQLQEAAQSTPSPKEPELADMSPQVQPIPEEVLATPRRSSRISVSNQVVLAPAIPALTLGDAVADEPDAKTDDRQEKPKRGRPKKNLKLTSNGKLTKSPTPSPKQNRTKALPPRPGGQLRLQHGKIAPSRKIMISYRSEGDPQTSIAGKIDLILKGELRLSGPSNVNAAPPVAKKQEPKSTKATHPFFMGKKVRDNQESTATSIGGESTTREQSVEPSLGHKKEPVPWSDIKFISKFSRPKDPGTQPSPWPPVDLQHIHPAAENSRTSARRDVKAATLKQKREIVRVTGDEDIFKSYMNGLTASDDHTTGIRLPERLHPEPKQLLEMVEEHRVAEPISPESSTVLQKMWTRALVSQSAFEKGQAAGPQDWAHTYAPKRADEVLQSQAMALHGWLSSFRINQVQSKLSTKTNNVLKKKAKRKRKLQRDDDLDDFIATSDDEAASTYSTPKNLIIICGPSGCGKSAAVYAVAEELGFEIFEIHPGMRRSAHDIFSRVGDMAQNHLVQPSELLSRSTSALSEDFEQAPTSDEIAPRKQAKVGSLFGGRKAASVRPNTPQSESTRAQKQSLILFEEVDILFEDDKSFWSGIQTLTQSSKRPIVLTCNSLESIPTDELEVHSTLFFEAPAAEDAIQYLSFASVAEGHLLDREDLKALYIGRGHDLRASLTDLNFWCQMTVGSILGGLDWMRSSTDTSSKQTRIISKGTYYQGLDIIPERSLSAKDLLHFAEDGFGLTALDFEDLHQLPIFEAADDQERLTQLMASLDLADARSCMDLSDGLVSLCLSTSMTETFPDIRRPICGESIVDRLLARQDISRLSLKEIVDALEPIMQDFRTFPPTYGRAATSLDGAGVCVATEVAPYVRTIVSFDQRLEALRDELAGRSQTAKQRKTRAARAALEGGDKANTRRERWLPAGLDFASVLDTLPAWAYERDLPPDLASRDSLQSSQATISDEEDIVATPHESNNDMYNDKEADI